MRRSITPGHPPVGVPGGVADDIRLRFNNAIAGDAFRQLPHQYFAKEIAGERTASIGSSERAANGLPCGGQVSGHPLDPLRTRGPRLERVAEILGLSGHLFVEE